MQRDGVSAGARNETHAGCWANDKSSDRGSYYSKVGGVVHQINHVVTNKRHSDKTNITEQKKSTL